MPTGQQAVSHNGTRYFESEPVLQQFSRLKQFEEAVNKGEVEITELYPGTLVTVKFEGWVAGPEAMVGWDRMLTDLTVNEGSLDVGNPSMTAFARLLTVFF